MIEVFRVVKDALASIACDDLIVAAELLKHLRAYANLANLADFISSGSDGNSPPRLANAFVARNQIG